MPVPEIVKGTREPRSVRLEKIREASAVAEGSRATPALPPPSPVGTVYVSLYRRYRVQVTAPRTFSDPATGQKTLAGKRIEAQFEECVYRNDARDPKVRKLIDESLQSNPRFGPFGAATSDFWLAEDQRAKMEDARVASAMNTLRSLPKEMVEEFVSALKRGDAEDHELPAAP